MEQMDRRSRRRRGGSWSAALLLVMLTLIGVSAGEAADIRVTAVAGQTRAGGEPLRMNGAVEAGEDLETGEDGRCSVLLAEAAVLQFCNRARLRVGVGDDADVVQLDSGELKASVGPRPAGQPLEIHTPAAIATILGTVIHVEVDAETGDTIVSSLESRVRVASSNPLVGGSVVLEAGEQVTIRRGEAPERKRRFDLGSFSRVGSCTFDDDFRHYAVQAQRAVQTKEVIEEITLEDVPVDDLPPVAQGPRERVLPAASPSDDQPLEACLPGLCEELTTLRGPLPPAPCVGTPGDHCAF